MARKLRVEYPGAIYHVMNRGDRREPIFKDDVDRQRFVETLGEACAKTACLCVPHADRAGRSTPMASCRITCLCRARQTGFHLVVETPQPNLVAGMKWFLGTYTSRFNRRHKLFGHLFSGRYKSLIVNGSGSGYLKSVCDYVHLNPARAKLVSADQPLKSFAWSSWPAYLLAPSQRPAWRRVDRLLGECGIPKDSPAGRQRLGAGAGSAARRGGGRGVQGDPSRLVPGGGDVSEGVAGPDERADGGGALRGGARGNGGGQGGRDHRGGIAATEVAGRRSQNEAQGGCGEVGAGGAIAGGDDDDGGMDRGAPGPWNPGLSEPSAVSPEKVLQGVAIIKN